MISAADRARQAQAVTEIFDLMRKHGLTLADLIQIGGEDLNSPDSKCAEKARRVGRCWELMARLLVKFADLEAASSSLPDKPARRRRGERVFSEVIENKEDSSDNTGKVKPLKNNNKTDNHSVELSENSAKGRWKHKRRLAPDQEGAVS